jgi:ketosteroid isomerase-like protein
LPELDVRDTVLPRSVDRPAKGEDMAHPNEEIARGASEALSKRDMEAFFGYQADDVVVHFPGKGPMAGDYRGKDGLAKLFERQMEMLEAPPVIETHDVLASDDHAVVLNTVRGTVGGKTLEQQQVVVMHIKGGKITETWLQFSEQQAMDEMTTS